MPLIVFEGADASGKKTQAELLTAKLEKEGRKAVLLAFPSYDKPFGKMVASYLKGEFGPRENLSKKFVSLLYALDRYSRKEEIEGYLKKGFVVVLDRYTQANLAYQTAELHGKEREEMLEWIETVENELPKASAVVFLDVPPEQTAGMIENRENKIKGVRKDIHEKDAQYAKKVYENYLRLAEGEKWVKIACLTDGRIKAKEEIAEEVYAALRERKVL